MALKFRKKLSFSLTTYMVSAVVLVHVVLTPFLFSTILDIYKSSSNEQFMLHAREISGIIADELAGRHFDREREEVIGLLDSAILGGKVRYIDILSGQGQSLVPTEDMSVSQKQYAEDSRIGEHGDDIYFVQVPAELISENDNEFSLRLGFDESAINDEYGRVVSRLVYLIGFYFLFMTLFVTVITRYIHKPLQTLGLKSRMIAEGDVSSLLEVPSNIKNIRQLSNDLEIMRRSLMQMANDMQLQATHDELTGLPNRYLYRDRLDQAIALASRKRTQFAVLLLDLNRFKEINDTLGHGFGDKVLQQISTRMLKAVRESDTIARIGGDEFSMILVDVGQVQAETIARKLIKLIEPELEIEGHSLKVGASVGVAIYPEDGDNSELLMQHADVAMYHAKHNNLDVVSYHRGMDRDNYEKLVMVSDFKNSIAMNQFEALFQSKFDAKSNRVIGCELLLRWRHPYLGMISPEKFIPLAEQENLIGELTRWATGQYLKQFVELVKKDPDFHVAINVSPVNLLDSKLLNSLQEILDLSKFPASNLIIEITENVIMKNPERSAVILREFHDAGISVAIDDFGTGYSSLAYLQKFPISELKIDKSFISDLESQSSNYAIVKASIAMAHDLGIKVVAEGVETPEVHDLLLELGCDRMQGFFYQYPLPIERFKRWFDEQKKLP